MASATELKKGSYMIYKGKLVEVSRKEVVAYGTHSHTKLKIFFHELGERGESNINMHHTDSVEIADITRKTGQVISKADDKVQVMDSMTYETLDASATKEVLNEIKEGDEVVFIDFNGSIQIIEKK